MAVCFALLVVAAWFDVRSRTVHDAFPITLFALAVVSDACGFDGAPGFSASALGAVVGFVPPTILFSLGAMGGGDVKLLSALGAVLGPRLVLELLWTTALAGGALAALILVGHTIRRSGQTADPSHGTRCLDGRELPYVPAIAAGFLLAWCRGSFGPPAGGLVS